MVEIATLPFRTVKDPTTGGQGRSRQGKMRIAARSSYRPRASHVARLAPIGDFSARGCAAPGARVITAWSGYPWPARPRPPAQGRRCNARPSRADLDPSCVLEPEALGARNLPWPGRDHRRYLASSRWNRRRHTRALRPGIGTRADYRRRVPARPALRSAPTGPPPDQSKPTSRTSPGTVRKRRRHAAGSKGRSPKHISREGRRREQVRHQQPGRGAAPAMMLRAGRRTAAPPPRWPERLLIAEFPQPGAEIGDVADAVRDAALHGAVCDQRHGALAPSVE